MNLRRRIILSVIALHAIVLAAFFAARAPHIEEVSQSHVVVQTVKLAKPEPKPIVKAKPAPKPKPKTKPKPAQKPTPKPVAKAKPDPTMTKLMEEATKSIAKIAPKTQNRPKPLRVDDSIAIADRLKRLLTLPEYGSVRIALTLGDDGKVANLAIIEAQSEVNREYVLAKVSTMTFAAPSGEKRTFNLTLNNEV